MSLFKRASNSRKLTGVGRILCASHRDRRTNQMHGHTWEVTAWFTYDGTDQSVRLHQLNEAIGHFDHRVLPDHIAWGEALAEFVGNSINREAERTICVAVDVSRPLERIYARWEAA